MRAELVIYGKSQCVWCVRVRDLASRYNLRYEYRDIGLKRYYDQMKQEVPYAKTVPQVFWGGRYIGGFNELSREIENTMGGYGDQLF